MPIAEPFAANLALEIVESIDRDARTAYRPLYRIVVHWTDWERMGEPLYLDVGQLRRQLGRESGDGPRVPVHCTGRVPGRFAWHYMREKRKRQRVKVRHGP